MEAVHGDQRSSVSLMSPNTAEFSHLLFCQATAQGDSVITLNQPTAKHRLHTRCLAQGGTAQGDTAHVLCRTSSSLMLSCMAWDWMRSSPAKENGAKMLHFFYLSISFYSRTLWCSPSFTSSVKENKVTVISFWSKCTLGKWHLDILLLGPCMWRCFVILI